MSSPALGAAPSSRPLLPVLLRMAAGLLLCLFGGVLVWRGSTLKPTPGLGVVSTPFSAPLDGSLPFDVARDATLRFQGDIGEVRLTLAPLPADSPDVLRGEVRHRARNVPRFGATRRAGTLDARLRLDVQPLEGGSVVVSRGPEPLLHRLDAALTPRIPVTLNTLTGVGDQALDLRTLRLRALTARTGSGALKLILPARPAGPLALITGAGAVEVSSRLTGAQPEALRVNTRSGSIALDLGGARIGTLSVGSSRGDIRLTLPAHTDRGSVTTTSGDVQVRVRPGSSGNLDIRTQSGHVRLGVPAGLRVRVRFTDRDTLSLPPTPAGQATPAPQLDVFVDAPESLFTLETLPHPSPSPTSAPKEA